MKQRLLTFSFFLMSVFCFGTIKAQTVSGTVTDGEMPLPGVNIMVKGTSNGTTTDFDGKYNLTDIPEDAVLVFRFLGFATQEISLNGRASIDVILQEDAAALGEVLVIGYGTIASRDATGAVTTITSEDFNRGVVSSPEQLIQGRTAGLQVTSSSGEPGSGMKIRIRGTTSVRGGNEPLFVVDGVPLSGAETTAGGSDIGFGSSSSKNPLNFLNPSDIESMSVLKDASATAIYGSRGANGVVIITTKQGRGAEGRFEYGTTLSVASPSNRYDLLDREEFLNAYSSIGGDATAVDYGSDTDFQDEILRTAFQHNHNLAYSNSYDNGNYRASVSYGDYGGIIEKSSMERFSGRLNWTHRLFDDRLTLNLQSTLSRVNDERPPISNDAGFEGSLLGAAYRANPTNPADPDYLFASGINPLALLKYSQDETESDRALLNFSADYAILPGLMAKINLGYDKSKSFRGAALSPDILGFGESGVGRASINEIEATNRLMEITLNYEKEFGDSKINALVGYSFQDFDRQGSNISGLGFPNASMDAMVDDLERSRNIIRNSISGSYQQFGYDPDGLFVNRLFPEISVNESLSTPTGIPLTAVSGETFHTVDELQSFFGRVNYNLMGKYMATATLRLDGSTRFGGNNKYGSFPSAAVAWLISEEEFLPEVVSNLKLRVGYGATGNQEIGYNLYQTRERFAGIGIGAGGDITMPGTEHVAFASPDLQWEETSQTNIGLDYGFFNNRLKGSIDYYHKKTTHLLMQIFAAQPAPQPFNWMNLDANVINEGVEFSLNYNIIEQDDLFWDLGFNISYNENMVENYNGTNATGQIHGQGLTGAYAQRLEGGQPLFSYYLREFVGFDENGQSIYEGGDVQKFIGKGALPKTNLGISTHVEYHNWDLSVYMAGQYGHYIYNNTQNALFTAGALNSGSNVTQDVIGNGEASNNAPDVSTRFLEKGDFLRLQNATLGYNFGLGEDSFFDSLRMSLTGQNLFVITDYSGLDPEVDVNKSMNGIPTAGIDYTGYPRATTVTFGLNVSF